MPKRVKRHDGSVLCGISASKEAADRVYSSGRISLKRS